MAGDLQLDEFLTILDQPPQLAGAAAPAAGGVGPAPEFLHRYGKVLIGLDPPDPAAPARGAAPAAGAMLSDTERMGLEAFRLRQDQAYGLAKQRRAREGEVWNMMGCTAAAQDLPKAALRALEARASAPTSAYLEGSVAVGIVIVEGPTADLQFSEAERTKVVAEVQNGLSWLAARNPFAGISYTYDIRVVRIDTAPNPSAPDLEALWRDPAMRALGYSADWNGVVSYVEDNRTRFGTRWTYCGYFTKYPLSWFAYASIGGPRLVMQYSNDGWGPDNIDRVFTHESGHIFGCPDEYASSGCSCGGSWGRFGRPNSNCENCAPGGGVACLMKANSWEMCNVTPAHLGWLEQVPTARGTPALIQSRFGTRGNFELLVPDAAAGLTFSFRNNDDPVLPWSPPLRFGQSAGTCDGLTMIQSRFATPGNLEVIGRFGSQLQFFWRDSGPAFRWNGPFPLFGGVQGNPVLIQSRFGSRGNFELACPAASGGGILSAFRNNDDPSLPWSAPFAFGRSAGPVDAISMIQSSFGSPGNLEIVARTGDRLVFFWRDSGPTFRWNGPFPLFAGVQGNPVLIQSRFGKQGNFELACPAASGGGILYAFRNNDDPKLPWSAPIAFGQSIGSVDGISMIQSNYGTPGNIELVARAGDRLWFFWRDSGPAFRWNGPFPILTVPAGAMATAPELPPVPIAA